MKLYPTKALALLVIVAALTACAAPRGQDLWLDRLNRVIQPQPGGEVLCLQAGQFELAHGETVISRNEGSVTIRGRGGDFTIHDNRFDEPTPSPVALANRDMFGAFYRFDAPRTGYLVTLANPVQDGEFVVAWMDGDAFKGDASDSAIYARYGFGVGSDACKGETES